MNFNWQIKKCVVLSIFFLAFPFASQAQTWTTPINVSNTANTSTYPAIALESNGTLHLTWQDATSNYEIYYSYNDGTGWSAPQNISNNINPSQRPAIAVSSTGTVCIAWAEADIFISCNNGSGWSVPENVSNGFETVNTAPSLVIDSFGVRHIAWWGKTGDGNERILYSKNEGSGWTPPVVVESPRSVEPSLAIDSFDTLHLVYYLGNLPDVYYRKNDGSGWTARVNLSNNSGVSRYPEIAVDKNNILHVIWSDNIDQAQDYEILYSKNEGSGWTAPLNISNNSIDSGNQQLAIDTDGSNRIYTAWSEWSVNNWEIFFIENNGSGWNAPINLTNSLGHSDYPSLVSENNGTIHLVWSENISGNEEIFYSKRSNQTNPIPTLSEWGLIILASIMLIIIMWHTRKKTRSIPRAF